MRVFEFGKGRKRTYTIKPQTEAEDEELAGMSRWKMFLLLVKWQIDGKVILKVASVEDIPEGLVP